MKTKKTMRIKKAVRKTAKKKTVKARRPIAKKKTKKAVVLQPLILSGGKKMSKRRKTVRSPAKRRKPARKKSSGTKSVSVFTGFEGSNKQKPAKARHKHRKHSFMSGVGGKSGVMSAVMDGSAVVGGVIGASAISKLVPVANPKVKALIPVALGIGLGMTKIGKSGIGKNIAIGAVAIGILNLVKQFAPALPLMGEEYFGIPTELSSEESAVLGIPYQGELIEGQGIDREEIEGEEFDGDTSYISSDDIE